MMNSDAIFLTIFLILEGMTASLYIKKVYPKYPCKHMQDGSELVLFHLVNLFFQHPDQFRR